MTLDAALRLSEAMLAFALLLQSLEHLVSSPKERSIFLARLPMAGALLIGLYPGIALWGLFLSGIVLLHRFDGPYNGGSDRLGFLALLCLTLAETLPALSELALGYLALQVTLSYVVSGWVKLCNPDWRNGTALARVFSVSVYPVSEGLRHLSGRDTFLWLGSWSVILFELAMPLGFLSPHALAGVLALGAVFHLANACLFGLNRFFWVWISTYPVLFWFQERLFA